MAERLDLSRARVLVTGGAGFIGSNFVHHLLRRFPDSHAVVLDALTYAGRRENLDGLPVRSLTFAHGDIRDPEAVARAMSGCDVAINFAAESHVDRSLERPGEFIQTDVFGVFVLCEEARRQRLKRFLQVSTDEVYGEVLEGHAAESHPLMPRSPYAASKAGGDRLAYAYWASWGLPVVVSRASNNYGPRQYPEKLISLFITNAIDDQPLPVYGTGLNRRDWLHVEDHCAALVALLEHAGIEGETFNIGAQHELDVLTITETILRPARPRPALRGGFEQADASVRLAAARGVRRRHPRHRRLVPEERVVVATDQGRRVPRLLRTHVRGPEGAEGGADVNMRRTRGLTLALVLALAMPVVAATADPPPGLSVPGQQGQESPPTPSSPNPAQSAPSAMGLGTTGIVTAPVDPETYVVGPGDLFQLTLSGRVSRTENLAVGPEGDLLIPGSGPVRISGLTLTAARTKLLRWLGEEFRGVRLDLQLARVRLMRVYLTGDVRNPGPAQVAATSRLSEALPADVLAAGASRRNVEVRRRDGTRTIGDLDLFNRTGRYDLNPFLQDGDIIHVPAAVEFVTIFGGVPHGMQFELGPADSLRTLLDLAGGPLPSAQAEHCLLLRWRTPSQAESLWFDLADVYAGKTNPPLRDGDHAYVFSTARFHFLEHATIFGEVESPGVYPLMTGQTRLSDLIRAAHGFLARADLSTIRVFRGNRAVESDPEFERLIKLSRGEMTDSEYEILRSMLAARREDFRVDWFRLERAPELDILLQGGDVIRVDPLIASVRVEGEVRRPGIVGFEPRRTVEEYVRLAGGYSERAAHGKVRVTRSVTGQSLRARDVPEVSPGDLIWVPERPDVTLWQHLQTLIAVAAQVATLVIAVRR
jgi:dTDP-glucose 4,6-dehydratase